MAEPTTAERVRQAADILDRFNEQLHREGAFNTYALEFALRDAWGIGYQGLKMVMIEIMQQFKQYEHLAAYYAEFSNQAMMGPLERPFYEEDPEAMCVLTEFKRHLATVYGASSWHHDGTLAEKRRLYWIEVLQAAEPVAPAANQ